MFIKIELLFILLLKLIRDNEEIFVINIIYKQVKNSMIRALLFF